MIGVIGSELIKYKRTFTKKLVILAPLFFILYALIQKFFIPADYLGPWQLIVFLVFNWWPVIFIPLGIALLAALVGAQEKKAGNYRGLRAHDVSPFFIWAGKVIVMAIYILLATIALIISTVISGLITANGPIPWLKIFTAGFTIWVASLSLIPIQLWIATWKGTFFSMVVGFIGMIIGVIAAAEPYWVYVPWSWPTRLMAPMIGVHPNGVPLESLDPLKDPTVIPIGFILGVTAFIIITIITAVWFDKREIK